ncbi:MAG: cohesin domain-containing protein, partial [Verrucomicrobiota bacterium]
VGDVDGSWTNSAGASITPKSAQPKGLTSDPLLTVSSGTTNPTGSVSLNIVVTDFTGVTGIQFSMDWDPALLSYNGFTVGGLPLFGSGNIGLTYTSAGKLGIAWDDIYGLGVTLPDGTNLFTINFVARGVPGTSAVNISDVPTLREVVFGTTPQTPTSANGHVLLASTVTPPIIVGQSVSNTVFTVVFGNQANATFGIDYSTNLTSWLPVTNPQIIINGSTARWSDDGSLTGGNGAKKFYRVNAR